MRPRIRTKPDVRVIRKRNFPGRTKLPSRILVCLAEVNLWGLPRPYQTCNDAQRHFRVPLPNTGRMRSRASFGAECDSRVRKAEGLQRGCKHIGRVRSLRSIYSRCTGTPFLAEHLPETRSPLNRSRQELPALGTYQRFQFSRRGVVG